MQEQDDLNPAQRELELALKSLAPSSARIDPVAAAFAAGQRATWRRVHRLHSALAAGLLLAGGTWLAVSRFDRPAPHGRERAQISAAPALADQSMLVLRRTLLQSGLDALPVSPVQDVRPLRMNDSL